MLANKDTLALMNAILTDYNPAQYKRDISSLVFTDSHCDIVINPVNNRVYVILVDFEIHNEHCVAKRNDINKTITGQIKKMQYHNNLFNAICSTSNIRKMPSNISRIHVLHTAEQFLAFHLETCNPDPYVKNIINRALQYAELDIDKTDLPETEFSIYSDNDNYINAIDILSTHLSRKYEYIEHLPSMNLFAISSLAQYGDKIYAIAHPGFYDVESYEKRATGYVPVIFSIEEWLRSDRIKFKLGSEQFVFDELRNMLDIEKDDSMKVIMMVQELVDVHSSSDGSIAVYNHSDDRCYVPNYVVIRDGLIYVACSVVTISQSSVRYISIDDQMYNSLTVYSNSDTIDSVIIPLPMLLSMPIIAQSIDNSAFTNTLYAIRQQLLEYVDFDDIEKYKMDKCDTIQFNYDTAKSLLFNINDTSKMIYKFDSTQRYLDELNIRYDIYNESLVVTASMMVSYGVVADGSDYINSGSGSLMSIPVRNNISRTPTLHAFSFNEFSKFQPALGITEEVYTNASPYMVAIKNTIAIQSKNDAAKV